MGPAWPCAFESVTPDADSNLRGFMVLWGREAEPQVILVHEKCHENSVLWKNGGRKDCY